MPLTADRAKSAITFGGFYRLVDFALSNLVNGGGPPDLRADPVHMSAERRTLVSQAGNLPACETR